MGLILQLFAYNPTKTNLTYIGLGKFGNSTEEKLAIAWTRDTTTGNINNFTNLTKMKHFIFNRCVAITGDIEIMLAGLRKNLYQIRFQNVTIDSGGVEYWVRGTNISGNISVLSNKYNLEWVQIEGYTPIYGQLKDLKNLKKLYYLGLWGCSCTGSQTDLWNGGANITTFEM